MIGWTTTSTSKSNPAAGILAVRSLRDLLARWAAAGPPTRAGDSPVGYPDDLVPRLFDAFENMAVVAPESRQAQTAAEVFRALATLADRLPPDWRPRVGDFARRAVASLSDHVLTAELDAALGEFAAALEALESPAAGCVREARSGLAAGLGELGPPAGAA